MARYVDIDKMREFICPEVWTSGENCPDEGCSECFYNNGGAEDVAPVDHAEWFKSNYDFICTNCGIHSKDYHNYCPDCGAKMDKE